MAKLVLCAIMHCIRFVPPNIYFFARALVRVYVP